MPGPAWGRALAPRRLCLLHDNRLQLWNVLPLPSGPTLSLQASAQPRPGVEKSTSQGCPGPSGRRRVGVQVQQQEQEQQPAPPARVEHIGMPSEQDLRLMAGFGNDELEPTQSWE
eukprot:SAG22_NODE_1961_length_3243_cov_15.725827_5_plen_115_part_00